MQQDNTNQNQVPAAMIDPMQQTNYVFKFLSYYFDKPSRTGTFVYQGIDNIIFTEKITFAKHPKEAEGKRFNALNDPSLDQLLDRAMFLAFILLGTSYYKAHPTPNVSLSQKIDGWQAQFFSKVYQEGMSQYAFENRLTRDNLAHFKPTSTSSEPALPYKGDGVISLQSGGKDSLLVATLLQESGIDFIPWYVSSSPDGKHPDVIDHLFPQLTHKNASIVIRQMDLAHLEQSSGLNGHVPITYINQALAVIQAILNNQNVILTSIGQEGGEPHAKIGDMDVNHQWSKTWEAELSFSEYIERYLTPDIHVGSPIRKYSELRVSELFVHKCWQKYGFNFSSCNEANYKQNANNNKLEWCGHCAKCANSYLLFCPFLAPNVLQTLFNDNDLFANPALTETFKGLLGVDGVMKPFECVGTVDELRFAYYHKMKVPPIKVQDLVTSRNYAKENLASSLSQASERLGISKMFKGNSVQTTPEFNPNGNNGQYGSSYGQTKEQKDETIPTPIQKYDKNGNPLPPQLPEGWIQPLYHDLPFIVPAVNFDYAKEFDSQKYFANFFEEYKKK